MSVLDSLKELGLSEYEAKTYLALIKCNVSGASKLAEISGVPRTKIYSSLKSLQKKGWVTVYPCVPQLFKALDPKQIIDDTKNEYINFLENILSNLTTEADKDMTKFVVGRFFLGLKEFKKEIAKARSVWISNATNRFLKELGDSLIHILDLRIILFPGEEIVPGFPARFREANVCVVHIIRNEEIPAISIILDNKRTFSVIFNPMLGLYMVNEIFYDFHPMFDQTWESSKKSGNSSNDSQSWMSELRGIA